MREGLQGKPKTQESICCGTLEADIMFKHILLSRREIQYPISSQIAVQVVESSRILPSTSCTYEPHTELCENLGPD